MIAQPPPATLDLNETTRSRLWAFHSQFSENYFSYQRAGSRVPYEKRQLRARDTVLDDGCVLRHLLLQLLDTGFVVQGADITRDAIGSAVSLDDRENFLGFATIDELLAEGRKLDAIFLIEVDERLDDHWLAKTLDQVHALLKKGGTLIVTTPIEEDLEDNMVYCPVPNSIYHRWQLV